MNLIILTIFVIFFAGCGTQVTVKNCHNYHTEDQYHPCEKLGFWE